MKKLMLQSRLLRSFIARFLNESWIEGCGEGTGFKLGNAKATNSSTLVKALVPPHVAGIVAGGVTSYAVMKGTITVCRSHCLDGSVYSWGLNMFGQVCVNLFLSLVLDRGWDHQN